MSYITSLFSNAVSKTTLALIDQVNGSNQYITSRLANTALSRLPCLTSKGSAAYLAARTRTLLTTHQNPKASLQAKKEALEQYKAAFAARVQLCDPKKTHSLHSLMQQHLSQACDTAGCAKQMKATLLNQLSAHPFTAARIATVAGIAFGLYAAYTSFAGSSDIAQHITESPSTLAASSALEMLNIPHTNISSRLTTFVTEDMPPFLSTQWDNLHAYGEKLSKALPDNLPITPVAATAVATTLFALTLLCCCCKTRPAPAAPGPVGGAPHPLPRAPENEDQSDDDNSGVNGAPKPEDPTQGPQQPPAAQKKEGTPPGFDHISSGSSSGDEKPRVDQLISGTQPPLTTNTPESGSTRSSNSDTPPGPSGNAPSPTRETAKQEAARRGITVTQVRKEREAAKKTTNHPTIINQTSNQESNILVRGFEAFKRAMSSPNTKKREQQAIDRQAVLTSPKVSQPSSQRASGTTTPLLVAQENPTEATATE